MSFRRQRGADDRQKISPPVTEKWDGGRENACLAHSYFRTEEAGRGRGPDPRGTDPFHVGTTEELPYTGRERPRETAVRKKT